MTGTFDNTDQETLRSIADRLFMIVGMGRSGTSLLQAMITCHPDVMIPNETQFYTVIAKRKRQFANLDDPDIYQRAVTYVLETRQVRQMGLEAQTVQRLATAGPASWDTLFLAILTAYGMKHGATRVGEKSPGHLRHIGHLQQAFPESRFIQMVRDPRGTINSFRRASFGTRSIMMGVASWKRSYMLQQRWHSMLGPERSQFVTYESLVLEPKATLERICAFLDLPFHPQMLCHDQRTVQGFGTWQKDHMKNTLKPVFTSSIDRWRTDLRSTQIAMIEDELSSEMKSLGYASIHPTVHFLPLHKVCSKAGGCSHHILKWTRRLLTAPWAR